MRQRLATQAAGSRPEISYNPATQTCRDPDSTRALGCISRTAECSLGYGTTLPMRASGATPLLVGNNPNAAAGFEPAAGTHGVGPSDENIRLAATTATRPQAYALASPLYINSIVGFDAIAGLDTTPPIADRVTDAPALPDSGNEQHELIQCLTSGTPEDRAAMLNAMAQAQVLPRFADGSIECIEFNESWCGPVENQKPDDDPSLVRSCPGP